MIFDYWYMFFAFVGIATLAMSAGIGGATFFIPFALIVLKVPVGSAIPIGIFVEIFGFAAGVYNYARRGQIDYLLAKKTAIFAVPFVIAGVILGHAAQPTVVEYLFILALMIFATQLLVGQEALAVAGKKYFGPINAVIAAIGGALLGFLSTGLGESNEYNFFSRLKRSPAITAGTSVLVVAVSAVVATAAQFVYLLSTSRFGAIEPYTMLIIYSVLGAMVGAKLGSHLADKVDRRSFRKLVGVALFFVAVASLAKAIYL